MCRLKIAIQKNGRLYDDSIRLLKNCGISYNDERDQLKVEADNFPLEIFLLRNSDIPQYLEDGVVDVAIIGSNLLAEKQKKIKVVENLGFSRCRVSLQRGTNETAIEVEVNLDGSGISKIDTGLHFFDHMLEQISRHGGLDLKIKVVGDLQVDERHTIEDTAIVFGKAV